MNVNFLLICSCICRNCVRTSMPYQGALELTTHLKVKSFKLNSLTGFILTKFSTEDTSQLVKVP